MPPILKKSQYSISSYGLYSPYKTKGQELPQILEYTTDIPIHKETEFGFIAHFTKAKGKKIQWLIEHPNWLNEDGVLTENFSGELTIKNNSCYFFLGDHFSQPFENKIGIWILSMSYADKKLFSKSYKCFLPKD